MGIITSFEDFMEPRRFRQGPPHTHESASGRMFRAIYEVQQVNMPLQQMRGQRSYERTRRPSRFFASGAWR